MLTKHEFVCVYVDIHRSECVYVCIGLWQYVSIDVCMYVCIGVFSARLEKLIPVNLLWTLSRYTEIYKMSLYQQ